MIHHKIVTTPAIGYDTLAVVGGLYAATSFASVTANSFSVPNIIASMTAFTHSMFFLNFFNPLGEEKYINRSNQVCTFTSIPILFLNLFSRSPKSLLHLQERVRDYGAQMGQGVIALYVTALTTHRFFHSFAHDFKLIGFGGSVLTNALVDFIKYEIQGKEKYEWEQQFPLKKG